MKNKPELLVLFDEESGYESHGGDIPTDHQLLAPYFYVSQMRQSYKRLHLIDSLSRMVHLEDVEVIREVKGLLSVCHDASLIMDDIEDGSDYRRGNPAAHTKYGVGWSINTAYMALFFTLANMSTSRKELDCLLEVHRGQGIDIYWREKGIFPSIQSFKMCAKMKTGCMFRMGLIMIQYRVPQAHRLTEIEFTEVSDIIDEVGILYQMLNDLFNLMGKQDHEKGRLADDLDERKRSFVLAVAMEYHPEIADELQRRVDTPNKLEGDKRAIITLLREHGIFEEASEYANTMIDDITRQLKAKANYRPLLEWFNCMITKTGWFSDNISDNRY